MENNGGVFSKTKEEGSSATEEISELSKRLAKAKEEEAVSQKRNDLERKISQSDIDRALELEITTAEIGKINKKIAEDLGYFKKEITEGYEKGKEIKIAEKISELENKKRQLEKKIDLLSEEREQFLKTLNSPDNSYSSNEQELKKAA